MEPDSVFPVWGFIMSLISFSDVADFFTQTLNIARTAAQPEIDFRCEIFNS